MTEQPEQEQTSPWQFAAEYEARFKDLPASQRREAVKRLVGRRRNPLSEEQIREPSEEIEAVLTAVHKAYLSKKARSKQASATKRMIDRAQPGNVTEPEPEAVEAVADAIAAISLEAAEVVAEAEPAAPRPTPTPQKSAPIPIPKKVVLPAAAGPAAAEPAKVPSTPAKKKAGLAARFA